MSPNHTQETGQGKKLFLKQGTMVDIYKGVLRQILLEAMLSEPLVEGRCQ